MLKINGNNIVLTRGDTLTLTVNLTRDGEPYVPETGDVIRFAVSKGFEGDLDYQLMLEKVVPNDTLSFTIDSAQTKIPYSNYNYDIQITHEDGNVDTCTSGKLIILGEVK